MEPRHPDLELDLLATVFDVARTGICVIDDPGRFALIRLLKQTRGNVTHAAKLAQRNRSEFYSLLHRHQLDPALFKSS